MVEADCFKVLLSGGAPSGPVTFEKVTVNISKRHYTRPRKGTVSDKRTGPAGWIATLLFA